MSEKNNIQEECPLQNQEIKTSIGGQALLEGIMMRGPKVTAMSVRTLKGEIVTEKWPTGAVRHGFLSENRLQMPYAFRRAFRN